MARTAASRVLGGVVREAVGEAPKELETVVARGEVRMVMVARAGTVGGRRRLPLHPCRPGSSRQDSACTPNCQDVAHGCQARIRPVPPTPPDTRDAEGM